MSETKSIEIVCSVCGAEALLLRKPTYEGFTKTGEELSCAVCGFVYAKEEDVPFKGRETVQVFSEADRPPPVTVFHEDEKGRLCRYCVHYVVNPFMQRCAARKKEVEATDSCAKFTPRKNGEKKENG